MSVTQNKNVNANSKLSLANLQSAFTSNTERMIGVELEFYLVDKKTGQPKQAFDQIFQALPESVREYVKREHLKCQIEIVSKPCRSLRELRDQFQSVLDQVEKVADRLGVRLQWTASHPDLDYNDDLVFQNARTIHNQRRMGPLCKQLQTCGVHFHVGVAHDEVIEVIDGLQAYIPLLVALASNSPIMNGRDTGRRSQRAAIWSSGFAVCGLSGPHGDWQSFNDRVARLEQAKRIEEPKDLYDFVRPTGYSTVEVRCCDLPCDLDQVIALAGLVQTLVVALADGNGSITRDRDFLRAELHEAALRGPEARLTDFKGDLVSPHQFLGQLVYQLQPEARKIGNDLALRLAPAVLAENGSTRQLQAFARQSERKVQLANRREQLAVVRNRAVGLATAAGLLIAAGLFAFSAAVKLLA